MGYIYEKTNDDKRVKTVSKIIKKANQFNSRKFYQFLNTFDPDYIICTHSFPAQVIEQSREPRHKGIPLSVVITDYGIHSYWLVSTRATYFVATKKMKWEMVQKGIPEKHVIISGIPVDPIFCMNKSIPDLHSKYHISSTERVVLLLSGGQGFMKSDTVLALLLQHTYTNPIRIIAVAGKNKKLVKQLGAVVQSAGTSIPVDIVGWTETVDEYLHLADVVVTKPGGSTTSECILLGKPMIVINPIPGQEEHNAEYIADAGYGHIVRTGTDLLYYVDMYTTKPMSTCSDQARTTPAAEVIVKTVYRDMIINMKSKNK